MTCLCKLLPLGATTCHSHELMFSMSFALLLSSYLPNITYISFDDDNFTDDCHLSFVLDDKKKRMK